MKTRLQTIVAVLGFAATGAAISEAVPANYLRGTINGGGTDSMIYEGGVWRKTLAAGSTEGAWFKFDASGSWAAGEQWGAGQSITPPGAVPAYDSGGDGTYNQVSGTYYSFAIYDVNLYEDTTCAIQATSADPVTFGLSGQESGDDKLDLGADNTVTVTVSSASFDETIYVRYTTDDFATSTLLPVGGSGLTRTVVIPDQVRGTIVKYYAFSSTFAEGDLSTDIDLKTIRYDNAGYGNEATYTVYDLGHAWHYAQNPTPWSSVFLDNGSGSYVFDGTEGTAYIASATQYQGGGDAATPSLLTVYHRKAGDVSWNSDTGGHHYYAVNDNYFRVDVDLSGYSQYDVIEYYLEETYSADADTTYIYGSVDDNQSYITGIEATAQASPFSFHYGTPLAGMHIRLQ